MLSSLFTEIGWISSSDIQGVLSLSSQSAVIDLKPAWQTCFQHVLLRHLFALCCFEGVKCGGRCPYQVKAVSFLSLPQPALLGSDSILLAAHHLLWVVWALKQNSRPSVSVFVQMTQRPPTSPEPERVNLREARWIVCAGRSSRGVKMIVQGRLA